MPYFELFSLRCVATLKRIPAHSFNALIVLILRDCVYNHLPLFLSLDIFYVSWVSCGIWLYVFLIFAFFLTLIIRVVCLCRVAALKSLPAHSFNVIIIPILRDCVVYNHLPLFLSLGFLYVSWVSCGIWLYGFLIFAFFLTLIIRVVCLCRVAALKSLPAHF